MTPTRRQVACQHVTLVGHAILVAILQPDDLPLGRHIHRSILERDAMHTPQPIRESLGAPITWKRIYLPRSGTGGVDGAIRREPQPPRPRHDSKYLNVE